MYVMRVWIYLKRWKYTKRDKIRGVRKKSTKSGRHLIREIVYTVENPGTRFYTHNHHSSSNLRGFIAFKVVDNQRINTNL